MMITWNNIKLVDVKPTKKITEVGAGRGGHKIGPEIRVFAIYLSSRH